MKAWIVAGGILLLVLLGGLRLVFRPGTPTNSPSPSRQENTNGPASFLDVTTASGLTFVHDPGPLDGSHFMPQIMGSGAALLALDPDGPLAIYLLQNGGPQGAKNQLFQQNPNGTFTDVSAGSGLDVAGYSMGVAVGDVNNDGLPDVYLSAYGTDRFFLNQGKTRFEDATQKTGIDNPLWGMSASFLDYDRDGWLDLAVVNYLNLDPGQACHDSASRRSYCHPSTFQGTVMRLFRNRGCDPRQKWLGFEDRTLASGLAAKPGPGLGILCADFNSDGWPDLFAANDARANHLWINQTNGTFKEEAIARGVAFNALGQPQGNMGVAWGDADGDGRPDLFVTHLTSEQHGFWKQSRQGIFQEVAQSTGLTAGRWRGTGFGTAFADIDQDGTLDLLVVNGRVARAFPPTAEDYWKPYVERNQFFLNNGHGSFRDVSQNNPDFCGWEGVSRGLVVGDVNRDGALDVLVTQIGGPARLFHNVTPNRGHWLLVRAVESANHRDSIGAEIRVRVGKRTWHRLIQPGGSYLCSHAASAHFGLGNESRIDEIVVRWPDGSEEVFPGGNVDLSRLLRKGEGQPVPPSKEKP